MFEPKNPDMPAPEWIGTLVRSAKTGVASARRDLQREDDLHVAATATVARTEDGVTHTRIVARVVRVGR